MTNERIENPPTWLLAAGCPDWCEWSSEHKADDHYDDRSHISAPWELPLTADIQPVGENRDPEALWVLLQQHYREMEPRVHISRAEVPGIQLTLDEAEKVAPTILTTLATGRTGGPVVLPDVEEAPDRSWITRMVADLEAHIVGGLAECERQICATLLHRLSAKGQIAEATR